MRRPHARIICIGNPLQPADRIGPEVYSALSALPADPAVEVIDGGLHGLNLLHLLEDVERVVFVDTLAAGNGDSGQIAVFENPLAELPATSFDHAGGLAYLLRAAPLVTETMPEVWVVGAPADADSAALASLTCLCQELAHGHRPSA